MVNWENTTNNINDSIDRVDASLEFAENLVRTYGSPPNPPLLRTDPATGKTSIDPSVLPATDATSLITTKLASENPGNGRFLRADGSTPSVTETGVLIGTGAVLSGTELVRANGTVVSTSDVYLQGGGAVPILQVLANQNPGNKKFVRADGTTTQGTGVLLSTGDVTTGTGFLRGDGTQATAESIISEGGGLTPVKARLNAENPVGRGILREDGSVINSGGVVVGSGQTLNSTLIVRGNGTLTSPAQIVADAGFVQQPIVERLAFENGSASDGARFLTKNGAAVRVLSQLNRENTNTNILLANGTFSNYAGFLNAQGVPTLVLGQLQAENAGQVNSQWNAAPLMTRSGGLCSGQHQHLATGLGVCRRIPEQLAVEEQLHSDLTGKVMLANGSLLTLQEFADLIRPFL